MDDAPAEAKDGQAARSEAESTLQALQAGSRIWGGAVLGERHELLAATGARADWAEGAEGLMAAADSAGQSAAAHAHVVTSDGEVFAVRGATHTIVVVAPRVQLASLMLADMRAALRRLETQVRSPGGPRAEREPAEVPAGRESG